MVEEIVARESRSKLQPTTVHIVLHTHFAKSLFMGSDKPGKYGLIQFASFISPICVAEMADDPYAALFLLKTYKAINEARKKIKVIEENCQAQLDGLRGFEILLFSKNFPMKFPLRFSNKFSYAASPLITDIDYVTRLRLTLNRIGMMTPEDASSRALYSIAKEVFKVPTEWKLLNIKREDIAQNNEKAQKARELWGEIPIEVFDKMIKLSFLPSLSK
jgi:integrating conjugative element protein (TIGR03761 family)